MTSSPGSSRVAEAPETGRLPPLVAGVAQRLGRDRLLELREAAGRGVAVVARFGAGGQGRLDDRLRCREVRLTRPEPDHRATRRVERLRLRVDGEGRGLGDPGDACGDPCGAALGSCHDPHRPRSGGSDRTPGTWLRSRLRGPPERAVDSRTWNVGDLSPPWFGAGHVMAGARTVGTGPDGSAAADVRGRKGV